MVLSCLTIAKEQQTKEGREPCGMDLEHKRNAVAAALLMLGQTEQIPSVPFLSMTFFGKFLLDPLLAI